jgi:hypothetical protein
MKDEILCKVAYDFVLYLKNITDGFVASAELARKQQQESYLESLRGVWASLPPGFLEYIELLILAPLDRLGQHGLHEPEYLLLRDLLGFFKEDFVLGGDSNPVADDLLVALAPLQDTHSTAVTASNAADQQSPWLSHDEVTPIFNGVWNSKRSAHLHLQDDSDYLMGKVSCYGQVLRPRRQSTESVALGFQAQLKASIQTHYPNFFNVLSHVSDSFYRKRTKGNLAKQIGSLVQAYDCFFRSIEGEFLRSLQADFSRRRAELDQQQTFFCMVKQYLGVDGVLSILSELGLQLTQSQLFFLDTIKEELTRVALEAQDEEGEFYSLFYACYAGLFTSATEGVRSLYKRQVVEDAKSIEQHIKQRHLGEEAVSIEGKIDQLSWSLVAALQQRGKPSWLPRCLMFLVDWAIKIVAFFVPRLRDLPQRRIAFVRRCANEAKEGIYDRRVLAKRPLYYSFWRRLTADGSPLLQHRMDLLSAKQTRAQGVLQREYERIAVL